MQNEDNDHKYIIKMLKDQISTVRSKVTQVDQKISKMEGCCAERHKYSLDAQLQKVQVSLSVIEQKQKKLEDKLDDIGKEINEQKLISQQKFNGIQEAMKERCKSVQEDNNQFRTRITILEQQKSKREEQKITIKTQVIIGVLVALLTSLITTGVAYFSNIHLDYGTHQPQTVQTNNVNEPNINK